MRSIFLIQSQSPPHYRPLKLLPFSFFLVFVFTQLVEQSGGRRLVSIHTSFGFVLDRLFLELPILICRLYRLRNERKTHRNQRTTAIGNLRSTGGVGATGTGRYNTVNLDREANHGWVR